MDIFKAITYPLLGLLPCNTRTTYRWWLPVVAVVLAGLLFWACDTQSVVYRALIVEEGIPHFSIEYPEQYQVERNYVDDKGIVEEVRLRNMFGPAGISIRFSRYDYTPDPRTIVKSLTDLNRRNPSFRLMEERTVEVSGSPAEMAVSSIVIETINGFRTSGEPLVTRLTCLARGNLLGIIQMGSPESRSDADKRDYEHLLRTFKFLD